MGEYIPETQTLAHIKPSFQPSADSEPPAIQSTIKILNLLPHIEGGYYAQTDTSPFTMPSPYPSESLSQHTISLTGHKPGYEAGKRLFSTSIYYYLTPHSPLGSFHRNRSRIVHTLHRGRGRYVMIHPDGRVETFVVGQNIEAGERLQWVVEGGVWKASFLLEDADDGKGSGGLLITETVVPGFEFDDHEFLTRETAEGILKTEQVEQLSWLIREHSKLESSQ